MYLFSLPEVPEPPPVVVTLMVTVPVPAGAVAVTVVELTTVNDDAVADPNFTDETLRKFDPWMVTVVPPAAAPAVGEKLLMAGAAEGSRTWRSMAP